MDPITLDLFQSRLQALCSRGPMTGLPSRAADRLILLKSVSLLMDSEKEYGPEELTAVLKNWRATVGQNVEVDHVSLRRELVDHRFLERDPGGRVYKVVRSGPRDADFVPEVDGLDVGQIVESARAKVEQKRREHAAGDPGLRDQSRGE